MSDQAQRAKVVFVLPSLTAGGAERVLLTLMDGLDRARFEPALVAVNSQGTLKDLIHPDIAFHDLKSRRFLLSLPALCCTLKKLRPAIVVSTMAHMNFAVLLLKPFFPKTRFIVREAVTPSFILDAHPLLTPVIKAAYRFLYPRADMVISPAQAIIDEFGGLGMICRNHVLLRNPVDMERIRSAFIAGDKNRKAVHFIAAGRLHRQKGFDRLIEILPRMKSFCEWKLTILGEGPERAALETLVKEKGFADKVNLPGASEKPWLHYAAADCFLLPSRWEGLPNVVLEALACGTRVIASREAGGIGEIAKLAPEGAVTVADDMTGFLKAMEAVRPAPSATLRDSLLPREFEMKTISAQFAGLLSGS